MKTAWHVQFDKVSSQGFQTTLRGKCETITDKIIAWCFWSIQKACLHCGWRKCWEASDVCKSDCKVGWMNTRFESLMSSMTPCYPSHICCLTDCSSLPSIMSSIEWIGTGRSLGNRQWRSGHSYKVLQYTRVYINGAERSASKTSAPLDYHTS